jgi:hypothetical protein
LASAQQLQRGIEIAQGLPMRWAIAVFGVFFGSICLADPAAVDATRDRALPQDPVPVRPPVRHHGKRPSRLEQELTRGGQRRRLQTEVQMP